MWQAMRFVVVGRQSPLNFLENQRLSYEMNYFTGGNEAEGQMFNHFWARSKTVRN